MFREVIFLKVAVYSRKSKFTGKGESIENQIEMCKEYISTYMKEIKEEDILIYEDEGFSGKSTDRPQFKKMMRDAEKKIFNCIICYRLDRISRSVSDFSTMIDELNDKDISFICIKERFDTSTSMGRAMMFIASVFAQLERETIAERIRDNVMMLAKSGRWLGGITPTGYTHEKVENILIDGKIKSFYKLKFEPKEIEQVKLIYVKFMELRSLAGTSKYLIREGIKSVRSNSYFSILGIKQILQNPVYCIASKEARDYFVSNGCNVCFSEKECSDTKGLLSYNKRDYSKKTTKMHDMSEWIIAKGYHHGIIDGERWVLIQNIINENKIVKGKREKIRNTRAVLSGLISCSRCGKKMQAKVRKKGDHLFYYICESKLRGGKKLCDCPNLSGIDTDKLVCDYLMSYMEPDSNIYGMLEDLKKQINSGQDTVKENCFTEQIQQCKSELDKYMKMLERDNISDLLWKNINEKITALDLKLKKLNKEKELSQDIKQKEFDTKFQLESLINMFAYFKENFNSLSIQEKRDLIRILVQKIEWDGENLHIFIYGE